MIIDFGYLFSLSFCNRNDIIFLEMKINLKKLIIFSALVWSGLVWSGLVWSGLVWSGLVWSDVIKKISLDSLKK